mgnify:CR=1 FL=1
MQIQYDHDGYPFTETMFQGRPTVLDSWIHRTLLDEGIVVLGRAWEGKASAVRKANPAQGREHDTIIDAATDDPDVVAAAREFCALLDGDTEDGGDDGSTP